MREVDHHADAIHFGDDLAPARAETAVGSVSRGLAGVRVRELIVPAVRE